MAPRLLLHFWYDSIWILVPDAEGSLLLSGSIPSPASADAYTYINYEGMSVHETCCSCCISAWSDLQQSLCEQHVCTTLILSDYSNFALDCCGHIALGCFETNNQCSGQTACSTLFHVCAVRVWWGISCWVWYFPKGIRVLRQNYIVFIIPFVHPTTQLFSYGPFSDIVEEQG